MCVVPLNIGVGPARSAQHHDLRTRFYVLEDKESNIVIEASQPVTDTLPFDYEPVVDSFRFASD